MRNPISGRLLAPLRAQLTQGVTPDKLALTISVGTVCALFPFLGFTALLNLLVGLVLRLNQPILQTLNQLLGPLQLLLILVYVRAGELLWHASTESRFTLTDMIRVFQESSVRDFLTRFGWAGIHAFSAWLVTAPLLVAVIYFATRPIFRRWTPSQATT
ncbi:MAG: DUF2062 domain-containing protein [Verrucomicrobiota bacterium]